MTIAAPRPAPPARAATRTGGPAPTAPVTMRCGGCGAVPPPGDVLPTRCPAARAGDDVDHVLVREIDLARVRLVAGDDPNPFVRYRQLFRAWHVARAAGWADRRYVALVRRLDDAIASVDGAGFTVTPLVRADRLGAELGLVEPGGIWVKDETGSVGGSHKARHLMGIMLELLVAEAIHPALGDRPLAIASCGNAALAAAVVARAAGRRLDVFVPPDADPAVLERLRRLRATIEVVPRRRGERGDPTVARLRAVVAAGAIPFTCQGPENGLAIEGGQTLGYELAEAVSGTSSALGGTGLRPDAGLDRLVIQVGGGALASATAQGLDEARALGAIAGLPRVDTVQTSGGWPLRRAYDRLVSDLAVAGLDPCHPLDPTAPTARSVLAHAAHRRSGYMWPWDPAPASVAHGILDDETYDWLAVVRAMLETGGRPIVVDEATLRSANALAARATGIPADETATAGLAGVLALRRRGELRPTERVAVLFTGVRRSTNGHPVAGQPTTASPQIPSGRRR